MYIIYGIGERGRKFYQTLTSFGYNVGAFFDRAAIWGQELYGIPVLSITRSEEYIKYVDSVVIVSLADGNNHRNVVDLLVEKGFRKIIYLPMPGDKYHLRDDANVLRRVYRSIISEELLSLVPVPMTRDCQADLLNYDNVIQNVSSSRYITVWIPLDMVCSEFFVPLEQDIRVNLFRFFLCKENMGFDSMREKYNKLKKMGMADPWPSEFVEYVRNRYELFSSFMSEINFGTEFWEQSAAEVEYKNGIFIINGDGNHRLAFLYAIDYCWAPAQMAKDDYNAWINESVMNNLLHCCTPEIIKRMFFFHPYGTRVICPWHVTQRTIMRFVNRFLGYLSLPQQERSVFIEIPSISYEPVVFHMNGFYVTVFSNEISDIQMRKFFSLYYLSEFCKMISSEEKILYHTVYYVSFQFLKSHKNFLKRLAQDVCKYVLIYNICSGDSCNLPGIECFSEMMYEKYIDDGKLYFIRALTTC